MLDPTFCRKRQKRLLDVMQRERLDAVVVGLSHHVYYFTGHMPFWLNQSAAVIFADGTSRLIADKQPKEPAADAVETFEAKLFSTVRQDQPDVLASLIMKHLQAKNAQRVGKDDSPVSVQLTRRFDKDGQYSIDPHLWQMRRPKDPDELALIRVAIGCTEAMYKKAREIIEPGIPELKVFSELHEAAVMAAGEPLSAQLGNDFACGVGGGPARKDHVAQDGQLYILDLGPAYRGYFADNARAIAVNRRPTDAQMKAWQMIVGVFPIVERMARPGVRCQDIFNAVNDHFRQHTGGTIRHHLGHGVGLTPHEYPHLNPKWDDVLVEGEIFTAEPGIYSDELAGGIRIENNYVVTRDGVKNLTPFPLELT